MNNLFLTFSDGAKFAVIARNLILGNGYITNFSFWGNNLFATSGIPYLVPYLMSLFFKIFGVNDFAVISFSFVFYLLLIITVFLLGKKMYGSLVGILSAIAVAANINFIDYATSGASEPLFAFEIVLAIYLLSFKKVWVNLFGFLTLGLMYFSRPQAIIFITGILFFYIILKWGFKKGILYFLGLGGLGFLVDKFIIYPLSFKLPLTPIFARGLQSILTYSSGMAVSDGLRGAVSSTLTVSDIFKKVFYNLYNFYKAIPEIMNPYLFGLFVIGLFKKNKVFNISVLFMVLLTFLVTALTIPFYRYLHPVVPLIYIIGVATLYEIIKNKKALIFLILIFCVGQTFGNIFLDTRFKNKIVNKEMPPVYAVLSYKLKEITNPNDIVLTNLDTWGSWYGERKTVWFPLEPEMIIPYKDKIDAIYLTSYKMDDDNYYMGEKWREIFINPKTQKRLPDYKYVGEFVFSPDGNYQKETARAILLVRK